MKKKCAAKMANGGILGGLFPAVSRIPGFYGNVGTDEVPMTPGAYAALPGATVQTLDPAAIAMARAKQIAGRGMDQVDNVSDMRGLSDRQKAVAIGAVAGDAARQGVGLDVSSATDQLRGLSARQQLGLSQAQYGADVAADKYASRQRGGRRNQIDYGTIGQQPEGYKDGGMVDDRAESLLRRMAAKYGVSSDLPPASAGATTVQKPQTVAPSNEDADRRRGFRTAERWREGGDYPIDVKKYAEGGIVSFKGKGGPREDKIPVTVAGEKIMVSDGEKAVILPAKTASNPAALGIIGGLIQHTNDGRAPNMGAPKRGGKYAAGLTPAQLAAELYAERTGQLPPPGPTPLPQSRGVTGSFQRGASGDFDLPPQRSAAPTAQEVYAPTYAALGVGPEQPPADPKAGNRLSSGTIGGSPFVRPIAASEQPPRQASANAGSWLPEGGVLRTPEGRQQVLEMLSGKGLRPDVGILGPRATLTSAISPLPQSIAAAAPNQRPQAAVTNRSGHGIAAPTVRQAGIAAALNRDSGARTIDGGMTVTQMGAGFDPTRLQMAPGYGMASNAAGKTIGGNMSPNQYVAADGTPGARWDETQQHKDAIAKNERMKLDLAEIQAGKRRGADPMAIQAATQGIASTMLGNQAKQEEMRRSDQSQALLQAAITTKDPAQHKAAIQNYLASRGVAMKDPDEWEIKDGGESTVPDGMGGVKVVKNPPVAFHKPTRQWIKSDGSVGQAGGIPTPDAEAIKRDVASGIAQGKSKTAMAERLVSMGLNPAEYGL